MVGIYFLTDRIIFKVPEGIFLPGFFVFKRECERKVIFEINKIRYSVS